MTVVLLLLLVLNAALLAWLVRRFLVLQQEARLLRTKLEEIAMVPFDRPADLQQVLGSGDRRVLVMEILNPLQLAAQQSWFADKLGSLAPPLIRKLVYEETAKIMRTELQKYGVEGQLEVHRAA